MTKYTSYKNITTPAAIIGSTLEWYDFLLYAYFTPILAPLFFPAKDGYVSLILTYSVFAIGFLVRPLGAILIGRLGDLHGRRRALIFSIVCMTLSTVAIGLLPTYASIGLMAPIVLTLLRCVQGLAVSGEISSAASFLIEHADANRRGFAGSLVMAGTFLGILSGAMTVGLLTAVIPSDTLHSWGWRIPFLLSCLFGIGGLILRLRSVESPEFVAIQREQSTLRSPIKSLLAQHRLALLRAIGLTAIIAIGNYYLLAYFNTYLVTTAKFTLNQAMLINCIAIVVFLMVLIAVGMFSDLPGKRFRAPGNCCNRKRLFLFGCAAQCVITVPAFWLLAHGTFFSALAGEVLFAAFLAVTDSLILTVLAQLFPTAIRNSGASIGYNTCLAIFGGSAPLVAISLVHITHYDFMPAIYLIAGALLSLLCMATIKETRNQ